jgi:radical SAM superfamily enzyme YgiQ (UPF0313 family)
MVYINRPPDMFVPECDEIHVSVTYTYDMKQSEKLVKWWSAVGVPVKIGGPAFGKPSGDFIPGLYVKDGNTFTSRGCPNKCWFCSVWKREPKHIELEIKDGWNIFDDNLLAASDRHIKAVFEMLSRQKRKARFTGGLEAKILKPWHCEELAKINPERMYFAYDTPDDYEPLVNAGKMLREHGFINSRHELACYVLIGYPKDTKEAAEKRLKQTIKAGFMPYAMLYKDKDGREDKEWRRFQREWCNPIIVGSKMRKEDT